MPDEPAPPRKNSDLAHGNLDARDWWWATGGALGWTLVLAAVPPTPFQGLDFLRYFEPYAEFLRASLLRGELPWWNPYASLGRPFLADLQTASFYPATCLGVALGVRGGWMIATVAHGLLALLGFIRLMRGFGVARPAAWGGAVVFLFSAPLLARMQAGSVNLVHSLCYLPVVLWLAGRLATAPTRRGWAGLVLVWALQLLCSHPQPFWLSTVGAGLFATGLLLRPPWRPALQAWLRTATGLALACLCGLALTGFVLVPFAELVGQSNRAVPSLAFSASFAMSPDHWMSLITTASGVVATNWEYDVRLGMAVFIGGLAAFARWREPVIRGSLLLVLVSALIMAGEATPVFGLLYKILPGLASFRVPARAGVLVVLGLIIGATFLAGTRPVNPAARAAVLSAGLSVAVLVWLYQAHHLPALPGAATWLGAQLAWVAASVTGWWLWLGRTPGQPPTGSWLRGLSLPAVIAGQLILAGWHLKRLPGFPAEFPGERVVLAALHARGLDRQPVPARVSLPPGLLRENSGMIHGYATLTGFESLSLKRVWVYLHRAVGADPNHAYNTIPDPRIYEAAGLLGAFNLSAALPAGSSTLAINPAPDPRAYVASRITLVPDTATAAARMAAGHPFHEDVLVEQPHAAGLSVTPASAAGAASIQRFGLNAIEITVESPGSAVLVVAEAWYPGWHASIAGREVPCLPVNGWMRGVPVPAGRSIVRLAYRQNGVASGVAVSLVAGLVVAWAWRSRAAAGRNRT